MSATTYKPAALALAFDSITRKIRSVNLNSSVPSTASSNRAFGSSMGHANADEVYHDDLTHYWHCGEQIETLRSDISPALTAATTHLVQRGASSPSSAGAVVSQVVSWPPNRRMNVLLAAADVVLEGSDRTSRASSVRPRSSDVVNPGSDELRSVVPRLARVRRPLESCRSGVAMSSCPS